jgi:hypothetical protein
MRGFESDEGGCAVSAGETSMGTGDPAIVRSNARFIHRWPLVPCKEGVMQRRLWVVTHDVTSGPGKPREYGK